MKFIISIFLLILCILISQATDYYLQEDKIEGFLNWFSLKNSKKNPPITAPPGTPSFIVKYTSDIKTNNYLNNRQINDIYTAASYANNVPTVKTNKNLLDYLNLLTVQLDGNYTPPLPNLIFFCISIPRAFKLFYMPDETVPIPYNKLHANMADIFPNSAAYTQLQTICILWNQTMVLFTPDGPIIDPRNETFTAIIKRYIAQIKAAIAKLNTIYSSSYRDQ